MPSTWFGYGFDPEQHGKGGTSGGGGGSGSSDTYNKSRFFTLVGEGKPIIFLHNLKECLQFVEHDIWDPDSNRPYHLICRRYLNGIDKRCLACEKGSKPHRVLVMSVIDKKGFILKKPGEPDKEFKNLKRLFIIPYPMIELFVRKEKSAGGLKLKEFEVFRSRKQTSRLGDDFNFVKAVSEDELKAQNVDFAPFDYSKVIPIEGSTYESQLHFEQAFPNASWVQGKKDASALSTPSAPLSRPSLPDTAQPQAPAALPPAEENISYDEGQSEDAPQTYPPF